MTEKNKTENITIESLIIEIKDTHSQCVIGEKQGTNNSVKLGRLSLNLKKEVKKDNRGQMAELLATKCPQLKHSISSKIHEDSLKDRFRRISDPV